MNHPGPRSLKVVTTPGADARLLVAPATRSWWPITIALLLLGISLVRPVAGVEPAPTAPTRPVHYVLGISPFLNDADKDPVYRALVGFLLEDAPMGSSIRLYDAYHVRTIAQIDVPDRRAFRSAKTRANQFRDPIRLLKEFLAGKPTAPAVPGLDFTQAVQVPRFLDFVAANLIRSDDELVVMILGSPLHVDAKEPGFSMVDGYFPSDGHLLAPRESSIYSLQHREGALPGVVVHWGWFGDPWVSAVHQERVERFWTLYLEGQQARLGAFSGDWVTVFNALRADPQQALRRQGASPVDRTHTKLEMLRITREVGSDDWITRDELPDPAPPPPDSAVGLMKIGIRWRQNVDLDLYARPRSGAETLFFEHTRSPDGYYFKDYRSSPVRDYEFIEFQRPVNAWDVEARINFYEGELPEGPNGEIRVEFGGRVYSGDFALLSPHGNHGRAGRTQGDCWSVIDVPGILGLREAARSSSSRHSASGQTLDLR